MDGIKPIRIGIKDVRTPYSPLFDDIYFSAEDGIKESEYVYLQGTGLLEKLGSLDVKNLSIGEIGFGVGLNFILTLKAFSEKASPGQTLTYFSAEKFPVIKEDLLDLYSRYPELQPHAEHFLDQYPILTPGFHSIRLMEGRVQLILMLGEATEMFSQYDGRADFWYWDGFAPSKNPDAFSETLFAQVARLSSPQAQGSSFTAAGWVRRGLEAAGFRMRKRVGFGKKRECIVGNYALENAPTKSPVSPWFSSEKLKVATPGADRIAVIGAGLSGSAIASNLANRGFEVHLFDPNGIAARASGNSIGLFNVQLSKLPNPISRFTQAALIHFIQEVKNLQVPTRLGITRTGGKGEILEAKVALESSLYPDDFFSIQQDSVFFPKCGILRPKTLCEARLDRARERIRFVASAVIKIERTLSHLDCPPQFRLHLNSGDSMIFQHVVYAMGADHQNQGFSDSPLSDLPVRPVRGQLIEVNPTAKSSALRHTLVHQGYVSPVAPEISGHDRHVIGATYLTRPPSEIQVEADRDFLLKDSAEKWEEFSELTAADFVLAQVGHRLSTPDKLPVIGPAFDAEIFAKNYERALRGSRPSELPPLEAREGEWIFSGMGSRGITYSSLGAELLANLMCGEPLPIERDLWEHLHSARFLMRQLKKPKNNVN